MPVKHRRHSAPFKLKVCREIRSGQLGRREAQRTYGLSDNLIQTWLANYDALSAATAAEPALNVASLHDACEARIAQLERKVGQLVIELERRE